MRRDPYDPGHDQSLGNWCKKCGHHTDSKNERICKRCRENAGQED